MISPTIPLTLEKKSSMLDGITLLEIVDINCLNALINSSHLSEKFDTTNYSQKLAAKLYSNEKQQLTSYLNKNDKKHNAIKVIYKKPRHKYGRVFPDKSLGLTSLSKKIRNTLIKDKYIDIDLSNAQPKIIYNICKSNNIECSNIEKYIFHRDKVLNDVMETYGVSRNDAKNLFIRMAFFGTFFGWLTDSKLDTNLQPTQFINEFKNDLVYIANIIKQNNSELFETCRKQKENKKEPNVIGSMFSLYLQDYETRIMECVIDWISNNTSIMNHEGSNFKIATYEYDGIKLLKDNVEQYGGVELLIDNLQNVILNQLGFEMTFEVKPIDKFFEVEYEPYIPPLTKNKKTTRLEIEEISNKQKMDDLKKTIVLQQEYIKNMDDPFIPADEENINKLNVANNDKDCALIVIKLLGDRLIYTNNIIFYKKDNIWTNDTLVIESSLITFIMNTPIHTMTFNGLKASYNNLSQVKPVINTIFAFICLNNDATIYNKFHSTTKGRLCFKDGVLCALTNKFYLWNEIDFEYYTTICINREFNQYLKHPDFGLMNTIIDTIFKPFTKNFELFLQFISRALMGHIEDKNWATYVGNRDCGKGVIYELLENACGKYVGSFKLENILVQRDGNGKETARDLYWLMDLEFIRLAVSQETPPDPEKYKISSALQKKICSGGDTLIARRNYDKRDTYFKTDATLLSVGNHNLECSTNDCNEHRFQFYSVVQFKKQTQIDELKKHKLPENVLEERFRTIDNTLKNCCQSEEWANAFILILMNYYIREPLSVPQISNCDNENDIPLVCRIFKKYEITKNIKDVLLATDVELHFGADKKKLSIELNDLGVVKKKNKTRGEFRDKYCYFGIKEKMEDENESDNEA